MAASMLEQEIHEQPEVLARLLASQEAAARDLAAAVRKREVRFAIIAARGTSDNAGRYAQYLLGIANGLPVALATPSIFTLYHRPPHLEGALVIGISQSGESPDIVEVVEEGRRQGALTLAITNYADSPLARVAEHCLLLEAGEERAIAATKTHTAQLAALALFSVALGEDGERLAALREMPGRVAEVLEQADEPARRAAERWLHAERGVVIGRGYNYGTAFEIALKLTELTYLHIEPYSSADFRHGPMALVEPNFPALFIAPHGAVFEEVLDLLRAMRERGADLLVISDQEEALALASASLPLPLGVPEWLSPLVTVVPGQLLALRLAEARGLDPDTPRGLQKVTRTL